MKALVDDLKMKVNTVIQGMCHFVAAYEVCYYSVFALNVLCHYYR